MEGAEQENRARKGGQYKGGQACGVCGRLIGADSIRCPEDGIICHNNGQCSRPYNNKEIGVKQMLCIYSYTAKLREEERKEEEKKMRAAKVIFALLTVLTLFLLVRRWL